RGICGNAKSKRSYGQAEEGRSPAQASKGEKEVRLHCSLDGKIDQFVGPVASHIRCRLKFRTTFGSEQHISHQPGAGSSGPCKNANPRSVGVGRPLAMRAQCLVCVALSGQSATERLSRRCCVLAVGAVDRD